MRLSRDEVLHHMSMARHEDIGEAATTGSSYMTMCDHDRVQRVKIEELEKEVSDYIDGISAMLSDPLTASDVGHKLIGMPEGYDEKES